MSLELCILASGSGGNCTLLRHGSGVALIDAGIGPRAMEKRARGTGVTLEDVRAICLTHLDHDHFCQTWAKTIAERQILIFVAENLRGALLRKLRGYFEDYGHVAPRFDGLVQTFGGRAFAPMEGLSAAPLPLAHDELGSHGFVFAGRRHRVGYASDLGHVPDALLERFAGLHIVALESNYDREMELSSNRPFFLKQRIMDGAGHLSNEQALAAICAILDRVQRQGQELPSHIVLLHRSRQCNCPRLVRRLFAKDERIASRLVLAEQYQRTAWLRPPDAAVRAGEQLAFL